MNNHEQELKKFLIALGIKLPNEASVDNVMAILCQISLAVLFVFIIANVLFMTMAKSQIDILEKTPSGEALMDLQWQKLLLSLERVESKERNELGISFFIRTNLDGEREYTMDDVLSEGKIINERFKEACSYAKKRLPYPERIKAEWLSRILRDNQMVYVGAAFNQSSEVVYEKNLKKLKTEISKKVDVLYVDCHDLQCKALSYLAGYYANNQNILKGTELERQLNEALMAPTEDRIRLLSHWNGEVMRHVKSLFEEQKVPLLFGVVGRI